MLPGKTSGAVGRTGERHAHPGAGDCRRRTRRRRPPRRCPGRTCACTRRWRCPRSRRCARPAPAASCDVGSHADAEQHEVRRQARAIGEDHRCDRAVLLLDGRDGPAELEAHAVVLELTMQRLGHLRRRGRASPAAASPRARPPARVGGTAPRPPGRRSRHPRRPHAGRRASPRRYGRRPRGCAA